MNMKDSIRDTYVKYLSSLDWNVFGTFTHLIPRTEKYNCNLISNYYDKNSNLIDRMFYVIEKHKNSNSYHTHFLLKTIYINELNKSTSLLKRYIDIDLREINNDILSDDGKSLRVSYYLTKDIHKGGEYGFLGTILL